MKLLLLMGILLSIGCSTNLNEKLDENCKTGSKETASSCSENDVKTKAPYDINFDVNSAESLLKIKIDLEDGSYYVSPNTVGDFKGLLKIVLPENDFISIKGLLTDNPQPIEEEDPWGNGKVNVIRQNTEHTQAYELKTDGDFSVKATVQFVIEPKCTLEKIPVTIFRKDGKLNFVRNCP